MWKVVISFNLNSPLKLFFYSPILVLYNLLLKFFCDNIVVVFLNFHFLILNTTHLNNNNKLKKKHDYIKIIIIKLRDKEHYTFSYGPNLLLKLSTSHILHSYHLSHSHIQFTSEKREEREREKGESEAPVEIVVHRSKANGD